jgi:HK97 family phage portal protein
VPLFRRAREALAEVQETRSSAENPSYPLTSSVLLELFSGARTDSGVVINERNAPRVIAVYRAHALLGGTVGSLPLRAFTGEAPGGARWNGREAQLLANPGGIDDRGNPLPGVSTAIVFYETLVIHLLSWGNAYIVKIRDALGRVSALDLLMPCDVMPRWTDRTPENPSGKEFWVIQNGIIHIATPKDVIHVRAMGQSLLQGISPIGAARQALGLSVAAEEYGARLFGSGNLMSGIVTTDQRLRQGDAEKLRDRWREKMSGLSNAYDVTVMDAGARFQPISIPPEDSQFIQTREFAVTEIARLYGIPPHMLGQVTTSTSWGTGIEQQSIGFNVYTLRPWVTRIEQSLSNELLPARVNCRFNVNELLRGDSQAEITAHQAAILSGQEKVNEARAARGLPPVPGGDEIMFPINYTTLGNIINPPAPPASSLPAPTQGSNPPDNAGGTQNG